MPPATATKSKKLCSHFVKGKCAYGDMCSRAHTSPSGSGSNTGSQRSRKPSSSTSVASPKPRYPVATPSSLAGAPMNRSPTPPDQETLAQPEPSRPTARARPAKQDKDICNFYAIGMCEGGDECEFRHDDPAEPLQIVDRRPPSPPHAPPPSQVCRHYKKGKCREGNNCNFSHPLDDYDRSSAPSPMSNAPPRQPKPIPVRDESPPPAARPAPDSPTFAPASARDAGPAPRSRAPKVPKTPPDSDDEDRFADADADEDGEEATSEVYSSIVKPQATAPARGRAWSPEAPVSRRVYPVVASPKPVPHVVDIVPHWSQFADPKANGDTPFCKQLAQNQCTMGEQCRFRHSLTIDEYAMLFKDLQPNMWTVSRTEDRRPAISSPPTTAVISPIPQVRASTKAAPKRPVATKKPCDYWPLGRCFNGDECAFAHIGTPPRTSPTQPKRSSAICRNLQYDGECKYGSSCFYSHDLHAASGNQDEDQPEDNAWGATTNDNTWGDDSGATQQAAVGGWDGPANGGNGWDTPPADPKTRDGSTAGDMNGWGTPYDSQTNDGFSASGGSSRMRTRPGSRVCYDFSRGRCTRSNCRFSHDLSGSGENSQRSGRDSGLSGSGGYPSERKRGLCYDFQAGRCTRGDRCRFSHDGEPAAQEEVNSSPSGWDDQPADDPVDGSWGQTETQPWEEASGDWQESTEEASGLVEISEGAGDTEEAVQNNDDSWAQQAEEGNDGWGDTPAEDVPAAANKRQSCKAFAQGVCRRGESCRYLHELPEDQVQYHEDLRGDSKTEGRIEESTNDAEEAQDQVDEKPAEPVASEAGDTESELGPEPDISLERFMHHCTVSFNNRCSPYSVMTAADSCDIVLSNLPSDSTTAEISNLVTSYGAVKEFAFRGEAADSATACIKFDRPEDAKAAVKHLNDQNFGSKLISAKLDSRTPVFARSPLHSQTLMVSWPGATLIAWSYYPSITIAKAAAAKLDKSMFKDRKIGASFERPGKKGPYAIRLTSLPPSTTKAELDSFCTDPAPNLTTLGEPSYTQSPEDSIREELNKHGRIESFRICSKNEGSFKTVAYVTMQTYSAAEEASRALNKSTPEYLGKAVLQVQHIYLASYNVFPKLFECIRDKIGVIREKHKGKCTVLDDFDGYVHSVELRCSIDESTSFAEANVELGDLVDGSLVLDEDGQQLWDPYLELPSSSKAIDKINDPNSDVPCFVYCDQRLQCVRVYGSIDGQARGKKTLLKILKKVSEQCHKLELNRAAHVAGLVERGFAQLQQNLGENKVSFNIIDAVLTVRGSTEDFETADGVVSASATSPPPPTSISIIGSNVCPFCERSPVAPVKLTCRHAYCQACLLFALTSTAKGGSSLSPFFECITPLRSNPNGQGDPSPGTTGAVVQRCKAPLSYVVVRDTLAAVQQTSYLKALFATFVRSSEGRFFFCPTPDCPAVHRAGEEGIVVRCPGCASDVCPKCSRRVHDGSLCEV